MEARKVLARPRAGLRNDWLVGCIMLPKSFGRAPACPDAAASQEWLASREILGTENKKGGVSLPGADQT